MRVPILLTAMAILVGCTSKSNSAATILDKLTNLPIDSVRVWTVVKTEAEEMEYVATYSDRSGMFSTKEVMEGSKQCPNVTLIFEKPGYNTKSQVFNCDSSVQTVQLEPK